MSEGFGLKFYLKMSSAMTKYTVINNGFLEFISRYSDDIHMLSRFS